MYVKLEPFLIGIAMPLEFKIIENQRRFSNFEGPRSAANICVIASLKSQGFTITNLYCDGEGDLTKLNDEINSGGTLLEASPPVNHDSHVSANQDNKGASQKY